MFRRIFAEVAVIISFPSSEPIAAEKVYCWHDKDVKSGLNRFLIGAWFFKREDAITF